MGLKDSVVVVSEFDNKNVKCSTPHDTPHDYIMNYMTRNGGATECVTPVRLNTENFITRYMSRAEAVDDALDITDLKKNMRNIQGKGGVAFGYGDYSLSDKKLRFAARDMQKNYDKGKTIIRTVISFKKEYLQKQGIISEDFYPDKDDFSNGDEGIYRGNIDQLKLRLAIMNGLRKLSQSYDDLQYVGVIQVDTLHVHCHLAMCDRGKGTLAYDGTQKGKLTKKEMQDLRRGIDSYLDEKQTVKMLVSNYEYDKRNTLCFIKKYTHKAMDNRGFSQFLLACLPENKNLWRASTNSVEMKKPNSIVRTYVEELLQLPDSGYQSALQQVEAYARSRVNNEDLTGEEYRHLLKVGRERIVSEGMNSVYAVLKQIPEEEYSMQTPMLDVMSMQYEDMSTLADDTDPIAEFGFKLRSYKTRLDFHKKEMHKYHDAVKSYEKEQTEGNVDEASVPLYEYFKIEEEYNAMLLSKYNYLLRFLPPTDEYVSDFNALMVKDRRITNLTRMIDDQSLKKMTSANAERAGINIYGEEGGRTLISGNEYLQDRLTYLKSTYAVDKSEFLVKLADYGMRLSEDNKVEFKTQYDFDDVKALDLHHLVYDFPYDIQISTINSDAFVDMADKRYDSFQLAKQYLIQSGQTSQLTELPEIDINVQHSTADRFRSDGTLHTQRVIEKAKRKPSKTVRIDYDFYVHQEDEIKNMIKNTINSLQYE